MEKLGGKEVIKKIISNGVKYILNPGHEQDYALSARWKNEAESVAKYVPMCPVERRIVDNVDVELENVPYKGNDNTIIELYKKKDQPTISISDYGQGTLDNEGSCFFIIMSDYQKHCNLLEQKSKYDTQQLALYNRKKEEKEVRKWKKKIQTEFVYHGLLKMTWMV